MDLGNVKKGFGAEVRRRRNHLGFSQEELAERANLHRTYISDVEAGKRNPSLESIQRLAEALGSSIGSVFCSLETLTPAPQIQSSAKHPREEESVHDILLVEDNPRDVEAALAAFRAAKLANRVHVLRNGAEALDYLFQRGAHKKRDGKSSPQLILLSTTLPGLDGLEVLRRLKADERTKSIPVVLLSSSRRNEQLLEGVRLGAEGYLIKPVDFQTFAELTPKLSMEWALIKPAVRPSAAR